MLSGINLEVLINVYRNLEVIGAYNTMPSYGERLLPWHQMTL